VNRKPKIFLSTAFPVKIIANKNVNLTYIVWKKCIKLSRRIKKCRNVERSRFQQKIPLHMNRLSSPFQRKQRIKQIKPLFFYGAVSFVKSQLLKCVNVVLKRSVLKQTPAVPNLTILNGSAIVEFQIQKSLCLSFKNSSNAYHNM